MGLDGDGRSAAPVSLSHAEGTGEAKPAASEPLILPLLENEDPAETASDAWREVSDVPSNSNTNTNISPMAASPSERPLLPTAPGSANQTGSFRPAAKDSDLDPMDSKAWSGFDARYAARGFAVLGIACILCFIADLAIGKATQRAPPVRLPYDVVLLGTTTTTTTNTITHTTSSTTITRTTTSTSSTTVTFTTSSTTTTMSAPSGCSGRDRHTTQFFAQHCFCFYTGHCQWHFECDGNLTLEECQIKHCGEAPLEVTYPTTSFYNIRDRGDILTVPVRFYHDVSDMKYRCDDGGEASLTQLLEAGRRVFRRQDEFAGKDPEWQCLHLPGHLGVAWLHLHTFIGKVPSEKLPNDPPHSTCVNASHPETVAAKLLLRHVE